MLPLSQTTGDHPCARLYSPLLCTSAVLSSIKNPERSLYVDAIASLIRPVPLLPCPPLRRHQCPLPRRRPCRRVVVAGSPPAVFLPNRGWHRPSSPASAPCETSKRPAPQVVLEGGAAPCPLPAP